MKLAKFKTQLAQLALLVKPFDTEDNRTKYRNRDISNDDAVRDIDKRYRWDIFYAVTRRNSDFYDALQSASPNDAHLDTLLKSVVQPL